MNKNKIEFENKLFIGSLSFDNDFKQACQSFVENIEEPDGFDELSITKTYVPYGDTSVIASYDVDEVALEELQKQDAIERLKDAGVWQYPNAFGFWVECVNPFADNAEDCYDLLNEKAIKIIEEL